jgi:hypothetical protein
VNQGQRTFESRTHFSRGRLDGVRQVLVNHAEANLAGSAEAGKKQFRLRILTRLFGKKRGGSVCA